jgi:hypothetical protein
MESAASLQLPPTKSQMRQIQSLLHARHAELAAHATRRAGSFITGVRKQNERP